MNWRARSTPIMGRAPRAKPEAVGMEMWVEDRREHLRDGLADQPIHRSRHPQHPHPARRLGDRQPANGLRPVGNRRQAASGPRPMAVKPRPKLLGAHPVDPAAPAQQFFDERGGHAVSAFNDLARFSLVELQASSSADPIACSSWPASLPLRCLPQPRCRSAVARTGGRPAAATGSSVPRQRREQELHRKFRMRQPQPTQRRYRRDMPPPRGLAHRRSVFGLQAHRNKPCHGHADQHQRPVVGAQPLSPARR